MGREEERENRRARGRGGKGGGEDERDWGETESVELNTPTERSWRAGRTCRNFTAAGGALAPSLPPISRPSLVAISAANAAGHAASAAVSDVADADAAAIARTRHSITPRSRITSAWNSKWAGKKAAIF